MDAWLLAGVCFLVAAQRLLELRVAERNRRALLEAGGVEYGSGHYPLFFLLHGIWLVSWAAESCLRGPALDALWPVWLLILLVAEILRYWALAALGRRWTTRILVIPGESPIRVGPYRFFPHPNYLAVALELLSLPMLFGAWVTASAVTVLNALLLLGVRIPAERRAWHEDGVRARDAGYRDGDLGQGL